MNALIVYGTKTGCTQSIAEKIGEALRAKGFSAEVVPAEKAGDASAYDAVVVGSGVRAGNWHASAKEWVAKNAATLKDRPVAFFTCGLSLTDESKRDEARAYTDPVIESSGVTPVDIGLFPGWFEPSKFGLVERSIMKMMKAPQGDFRDFEAVTQWAESIAPQLSAGSEQQ